MDSVLSTRTKTPVLLCIPDLNATGKENERPSSVPLLKVNLSGVNRNPERNIFRLPAEYYNPPFISYNGNGTKYPVHTPIPKLIDIRTVLNYARSQKNNSTVKQNSDLYKDVKLIKLPIIMSERHLLDPPERKTSNVSKHKVVEKEQSHIVDIRPFTPQQHANLIDTNKIRKIKQRNHKLVMVSSRNSSRRTSVISPSHSPNKHTDTQNDEGCSIIDEPKNRGNRKHRRNKNHAEEELYEVISELLMERRNKKRHKRVKLFDIIDSIPLSSDSDVDDDISLVKKSRTNRKENSHHLTVLNQNPFIPVAENAAIIPSMLPDFPYDKFKPKSSNYILNENNKPLSRANTAHQETQGTQTENKRGSILKSQEIQTEMREMVNIPHVQTFFKSSYEIDRTVKNTNEFCDRVRKEIMEKLAYTKKQEDKYCQTVCNAGIQTDEEIQEVQLDYNASNNISIKQTSEMLPHEKSHCSLLEDKYCQTVCNASIQTDEEIQEVQLDYHASNNIPIKQTSEMLPHEKSHCSLLPPGIHTEVHFDNKMMNTKKDFINVVDLDTPHVAVLNSEPLHVSNVKDKAGTSDYFKLESIDEYISRMVLDNDLEKANQDAVTVDTYDAEEKIEIMQEVDQYTAERTANGDYLENETKFKINSKHRVINPHPLTTKTDHSDIEAIILNMAGKENRENSHPDGLFSNIIAGGESSGQRVIKQKAVRKSKQQCLLEENNQKRLFTAERIATAVISKEPSIWKTPGRLPHGTHTNSRYKETNSLPNRMNKIPIRETRTSKIRKTALVSDILKNQQLHRSIVKRKCRSRMGNPKKENKMSKSKKVIGSLRSSDRRSENIYGSLDKSIESFDAGGRHSVEAHQFVTKYSYDEYMMKSSQLLQQAVHEYKQLDDSSSLLEDVDFHKRLTSSRVCNLPLKGKHIHTTNTDFKDDEPAMKISSSFSLNSSIENNEVKNLLKKYGMNVDVGLFEKTSGTSQLLAEVEFALLDESDLSENSVVSENIDWNEVDKILDE